MPIMRTYQCGDCFHRIEVVLPLDQWDAPPPDCPACAQRQMEQEFKPVAVRTGDAVHRDNARKLAERIAEEDYGVADMRTRGAGEPIKHRLKDAGTPAQQQQVATWGATGDVLKTAMAIGRQTRMEHGDGLDVLHSALKSGAQPDLIEVSKRNMMRVK